MLDLKTATIAANRFGFGGGPGELASIAPDPRGWLKNQLVADQRPAEVKSAPLLAEFLDMRRLRKADPEQRKVFQKQRRDRFGSDSAARTLAAAGTGKPFQERLVQFW